MMKVTQMTLVLALMLGNAFGSSKKKKAKKSQEELIKEWREKANLKVLSNDHATLLPTGHYIILKEGTLVNVTRIHKEKGTADVQRPCLTKEEMDTKGGQGYFSVHRGVPMKLLETEEENANRKYKLRVDGKAKVCLDHLADHTIEGRRGVLKQGIIVTVKSLEKRTARVEGYVVNKGNYFRKGKLMELVVPRKKLKNFKVMEKLKVNGHARLIVKYDIVKRNSPVTVLSIENNTATIKHGETICNKVPLPLLEPLSVRDDNPQLPSYWDIIKRMYLPRQKFAGYAFRGSPTIKRNCYAKLIEDINTAKVTDPIFGLNDGDIVTVNKKSEGTVEISTEDKKTHTIDIDGWKKHFEQRGPLKKGTEVVVVGVDTERETATVKFCGLWREVALTKLQPLVAKEDIGYFTRLKNRIFGKSGKTSEKSRSKSEYEMREKTEKWYNFTDKWYNFVPVKLCDLSRVINRERREKRKNKIEDKQEEQIHLNDMQRKMH